MTNTVTKLMARVHAIENLASLAADPMKSGSEHMEYVNDLIAARDAFEAELIRLFTPLTPEQIEKINFVELKRLDYEKFEVDQESVTDLVRSVELLHGTTGERANETT